MPYFPYSPVITTAPVAKINSACRYIIIFIINPIHTAFDHLFLLIFLFYYFKKQVRNFHSIRAGLINGTNK